MEQLQFKLLDSLKLVKKYEWLLDFYMLDFYIEDHWEKLPGVWRDHLQNLPLEELGEVLENENECNSVHKVWPLELLALRQLVKNLSIKRKTVDRAVPQNGMSCPLLYHRKLKHIFRKCVKPKKYHEITRMAEICAKSHQKMSVDFVVDFGAGVGHLARILGYGYGIQVCCLEMQEKLNHQAIAIDRKLETMANKFLEATEIDHFKQPKHITQCLTSRTTSTEFLQSLRQALNLKTDNFRFGIIGLHPCGDLGPTLMRMFLACKQAKFLNFVSCCYQKMTTKQLNSQTSLPGYPLSKFLQVQNDFQLSYEAREVSCHANEMYFDRLTTGQHEYLKIHSLRAAAERLILQEFPLLRHCALRNVKHQPGMTFDDYFQQAVKGTRFETLDQRIWTDKQKLQTQKDLKNWRRIVCLFTLRLLLAPLVESIILYDRVLFLMENDCEVHIEAIFDPRLSPRNHITSAIKS
ncbi:methyltransferase-like protein 25B [Drosophila tropicalis]|uniref:methyltransferase-like protein 25B n=1 Tax=Drosophila tropicalis TaxID=46794 RepID=UPI0035ABBF8F